MEKRKDVAKAFAEILGMVSGTHGSNGNNDVGVTVRASGGDQSTLMGQTTLGVVMDPQGNGQTFMTGNGNPVIMLAAVSNVVTAAIKVLSDVLPEQLVFEIIGDATANGMKDAWGEEKCAVLALQGIQSKMSK